MAQVELDRAAAARGDLPHVCAYCGAPSTAQRLMAFVGRTPITITAGVGAIRARLPVCDRHRWHWLLRHLPEAAAFALWIALAVLLANMEKNADFAAPLLAYKGALSLTCVLMFLLSIVLRFVMFYTGIRMTGASWEVLQVAGVSERFARACYGELDDSGAPAGDGDDTVEPVLLDEVAGSGGAAVRVAAPVVAAPQRRGSPLTVVLPLAAVGALLLLCVGGAAAVWWGLSGAGESGEPIQLSNSRATNIAGLATHVKVDYRCAKLGRDASQYVLIVEEQGRRVSQRVYPSGALSESGTLELDVLGRSGGGLRAYVERRGVGSAAGERVSNTVDVD
jgi:hypothetical protein